MLQLYGRKNNIILSEVSNYIKISQIRSHTLAGRETITILVKSKEDTIQMKQTLLQFVNGFNRFKNELT